MRGILSLGCALVLCGYAAAQASSWVVVRGLSPGSQLEAQLAAGATVKGKLVAASPAGLELQTSPRATRFVPSAQVTRIYLIGKPAAGRDAWVGLAVGATVGSLYGAASANCNTGPGGFGSPSCPAIQGKRIAALGAVFGLVGAIVGATLGQLHQPRVLLYRRDSSRGHHGGKALRRHKLKAAASPSGPTAAH